MVDIKHYDHRLQRLKDGIPAKVETIEYDPNRSAILLYYPADGERIHHSSDGLKVGDTVYLEKILNFNRKCMSLQTPLGTVVHCIELFPGKGAQMAKCWCISSNSCY